MVGWGDGLIKNNFVSIVTVLVEYRNSKKKLYGSKENLVSKMKQFKIARKQRFEKAIHILSSILIEYHCKDIKKT